MTGLSLFIIITTLAFLLAALIAAGLSRHKKSAAQALNLIGATGFTEGTLDPEGAVIIGGELWRARAKDDQVLKARNWVRVVGTQVHLLVVEPVTNQP